MRILGGIWLVQALTVMVFWLSVNSPYAWQLVLSGVLVLGIGALAAFWVYGTVKDQTKLTEAIHNERLARKSMEFRTQLSDQKAAEAERLAELARNTGNSRTGLLRVGILSGGVLGLGAALVMAQFVGMALLLAAFSGGGAAGYALSNKVRRPKKTSLSPTPVRKWLPRRPFEIQKIEVQD
jgi:Flp pilus assembly protein TadB